MFGMRPHSVSLVAGTFGTCTLGRRVVELVLEEFHTGLVRQVHPSYLQLVRGQETEGYIASPSVPETS